MQQPFDFVDGFVDSLNSPTLGTASRNRSNDLVCAIQNPRGPRLHWVLCLLYAMQPTRRHAVSHRQWPESRSMIVHYRHHPDTHDTQLLPHLSTTKDTDNWLQRRIDVIQQSAKSPHVFSFQALRGRNLGILYQVSKPCTGDSLESLA